MIAKGIQAASGHIGQPTCGQLSVRSSHSLPFLPLLFHTHIDHLIIHSVGLAPLVKGTAFNQRIMSGSVAGHLLLCRRSGRHQASRLQILIWVQSDTTLIAATLTGLDSAQGLAHRNSNGEYRPKKADCPLCKEQMQTFQNGLTFCRADGRLTATCTGAWRASPFVSF